MPSAITAVMAGEPGHRGGDLDEQVGPVDDLPQLDGLQDGLVGVVRQARVDLDGHPAVDAVGCLVLSLASTSQALRTSSVVTVRMVASTSAPLAASSLT